MVAQFSHVAAPSRRSLRGGLLGSAVVVALVMALVTLSSVPAEAATPKVSLGFTATSTYVGHTVAATAKVRRGVAGQVAVLQQRRGTRWLKVDARRLPKKGAVKKVTFLVTPRAVGAITYRVHLAKKGSTRSASSTAVTLRAMAAPVSASSSPLRFNLTGAAGLAIGSSSAPAAPAAARVAAFASTGTGSNLDVVTTDGATREAVTSGFANLAGVFIAPNDAVYVLFHGRVNLQDTSLWSATGCLLAEVDVATGIPTCVDDTLDSITWGSSPVQFDAAGSLYYAGFSQGTPVLRRYDNGVIHDYINPNIYIEHWQALPTGTVLISGWTVSTGSHWTRVLNLQGGVSTLYGSDVWGNLFPDGNFYFNDGTCPGAFGIRRFDSAASTLDSTYWLRNVPQPGAVVTPDCDGPQSVYAATVMGNRYTTPDGRVVAYQFINNGWKAIQVARVYPTPPAPDGAPDYSPTDAMASNYSDDGYFRQSSVFSGDMTLSAPVGSSILFAGVDAGLNKLVSFDLNSWTLGTIPLPEDIEFYHLAADGPTHALFDGLRLADNQVVLGRVDLTTSQVEILSVLPAKWQDFQTF